MKENKGLSAITIILTILVIILAGYIIYEKLDSKEVTTNNTSENLNDDSTTTDEDTTNNVNEITSINDFPTKNDSSVLAYGNIFDLASSVDLNTNFKNKVVTIGNVDFTFNCEDTYGDTDMCIDTKISVNNKEIYNYEFLYDCYDDYTGTPFLLMTDKYIIFNATLSGIGTDTIYIYKTDGTLVRKIEDTADIIMFDEETSEETDVQMRLYNGKLYYVSTKDYETAIFNYYDFTTNTITKIEEFSAWTNQQA
jgi:hypothetical protein